MKKNSMIFKDKQQIVFFILFNVIFAFLFFELILRAANYDSVNLRYALYFGNREYNESDVFYRVSRNLSEIGYDDFTKHDILESDIIFYPKDEWDTSCNGEKPGKRIILFGDSVTHGHRDPDGKQIVSIDYFLSVLINDSNESYDVINFAYGGYQPPQIYTIMKRYEYCRPDIIIIGLCDNDLNDHEGPFQFSEEFAPKTKEILNKMRQNPWMYELIRDSYTARFGYDKYISFMSFLYRDDFDLGYREPGEISRLQSMDFKYFNETMQYLSRSKIPSMILIYPDMGSKNDSNGFYYDHLPYEGDIVNYIYSYNLSNLLVIDLKKEFVARNFSSKEFRISEDDPIHYNALGNSAIASIILDKVV